jgi:hypothetical protein
MRSCIQSMNEKCKIDYSILYGIRVGFLNPCKPTESNYPSIQ